MFCKKNFFFMLFVTAISSCASSKIITDSNFSEKISLYVNSNKLELWPSDFKKSEEASFKTKHLKYISESHPNIEEIYLWTAMDDIDWSILRKFKKLKILVLKNIYPNKQTIDASDIAYIQMLKLDENFEIHSDENTKLPNLRVLVKKINSDPDALEFAKYANNLNQLIVDVESGSKSLYEKMFHDVSNITSLEKLSLDLDLKNYSEITNMNSFKIGDTLSSLNLLKLRWLRLEREFGDLPKISNLPNLEAIWLRDDRSEGHTATDLTQLNKLKYLSHDSLHKSHNPLKLPPSVENIDIYFNFDTYLLVDFTVCTTLTGLDLASLNNLKTLNIEYNKTIRSDRIYKAKTDVINKAITDCYPTKKESLKFDAPETNIIYFNSTNNNFSTIAFTNSANIK